MRNLIPPIYPVFIGVIPSDISFFGFPFDAQKARGGNPDAQGSNNLGMFFVLEERVSEARFGIDENESKVNIQLTGWDNLNWNHFTGIKENAYINELNPGDGTINLEPSWNKSSAAIAQITIQKPVRFVIHAKEMIPE